jgi:nitrate reductase gamma subunit
LATVPLSGQHLDGSMMMKLAGWAQHIVTFLQPVRWICWPKPAGSSRLHMFLGMSIFVVFPFTRLVHVWSGFASVAYLVRPTRWCARVG